MWDALVDEDLVDGWLAAARIDARVGGDYHLHWMSGTRPSPTAGVITVLEPPSRLAMTTDNLGELEFTLDPVPGGTRGTATELHVRIVVGTDPRLLASTRAHWLSALDQLESLLRGHPVDWRTWQEDRGAAWEAYLREAGEPE